MTITYIAPDGVAITAQQFRQGQAATHGGGSGRRLGGRSGFRVDTPSTVLTATSTTWTLGPCAAMIDPGATTHQGMYGWSSDANETGTVTAADATNPRKDIVYIKINDSSAGDGSGALSAPVLYLAGTPGVTPVAPTLAARSFLVGTISVPIAGGGSPTVVLNPARFAAAGAPLPVYSEAERDALDKFDSLTVQRRDLPGRPCETWDGTDWVGAVRHVEYSNTQVGVPNNQAYGPSVMTADTGRSRYPGVVTNTVNDLFTVSQGGVYTISWYQVWTTPTAGPCFFAVDRTTGGTVRLAGEQKPSAYEHTFTLANVSLNAGETIKLIFVQTSGDVINVTHRVRITKSA